MPTFFGRLFKPNAAAAPEAKPFDALYADAIGAATTRDFERAIQLYDRAIALQPLHAEAYYKRGNALKDVGRFEAAVKSYDCAIRLRPDYAHAYCNRGVVQHRLGLSDAALSSYDRAIALDTGDAIAHCNRALLLQDCSRWDEAIASYDRSISINPQFSDAHYNRSLTSLLLGDFASGWRGYEWRWRNASKLSIGPPRHFHQSLWLGDQSIAGKTLLIYSEQGLGDTLQFCRYATLSAARGATVLLEVQQPLVDLLGSLDGVSHVIAKGSELPFFDLQCPVMSLPLAFETRLETIPSTAGYLHSNAGKVAAWRSRFGAKVKPRIGLAWSGNQAEGTNRKRHFPLAILVPHLSQSFDYFCLQTDVLEADQNALARTPWISPLQGALQDFDDTAAVCDCMDLVLTVDTSVAHLNGALGNKTWLLLPFVADWRWMMGRNASPWYTSMTLYRQQAADDWNDVFIRVAADLCREFRVS